MVSYGTIRQNLHDAIPDTSVDELRNALDAAPASSVERLPDDLETVVGDCGMQPSGGERQRIALVRAFGRPTLRVLDAATSALNPEKERFTQAVIERKGGRQAMLAIAHRLQRARRQRI